MVNINTYGNTIMVQRNELLSNSQWNNCHATPNIRNLNNGTPEMSDVIR